MTQITRILGEPLIDAIISVGDTSVRREKKYPRGVRTGEAALSSAALTSSAVRPNRKGLW